MRLVLVAGSAIWRSVRSEPRDGTRLLLEIDSPQPPISQSVVATHLSGKGSGGRSCREKRKSPEPRVGASRHFLLGALLDLAADRVMEHLSTGDHIHLSANLFVIRQ